MKRLLIGLMALGSISAFSCELDSKSQIDVDTWYGMLQTKQINQTFMKTGPLKLSETGLAQMNSKELLVYSQQFHRILSAYGHSGLESETVLSIQELKKRDSTVCELAKTLSVNYSFINE
jgi:uncharacterized lipoprotein NlpE involved in copper resistance